MKTINFKGRNGSCCSLPALPSLELLRLFYHYSTALTVAEGTPHVVLVLPHKKKACGRCGFLNCRGRIVSWQQSIPLFIRTDDISSTIMLA
jgi:hypothetical protein